MTTDRAIEIAKFNEVDENWVQTGGMSTRCVFIGPENDRKAPVGVVIKGDGYIADKVGSKRSFSVRTMTVVLEGMVMHDGRWMLPGDFYMAPPNEVNGDLLFGPDGGVIFIMFDKREGMIPSFADPQDQANFDKLLRKDVEAVAAGKCEKSVPILPLRDEYTKGRAIVFNTHEEIAKYRQDTGTEW